MKFEHVNIDCFGYALPPEIVTTESIERQLQPLYERLKLPVGRLELMSGIRERRLWKEGTMPSDAATRAGIDALESSSVAREDIDLLINCSVCRDFLEPATAAVVHRNLNLSTGCQIFDISNACLGILSGMTVAASMIESGAVKAALLVAGENSRSLLQSTISLMLNDGSLTRQGIKPLLASLTIGSGAVAVVLARQDLSSAGHRLLGGASGTFSAYSHLCLGNADRGMQDNHETLMMTDAEALMHCGVEAAAEVWQKFCSELSITGEDVSCFCAHQVGSAHRKLLFEQLRIELSKDYSTLENFGNTGSVSCPLTAALAVESGAVGAGDIMAMLGIGSGISSVMLAVRW